MAFILTVYILCNFGLAKVIKNKPLPLRKAVRDLPSPTGQTSGMLPLCKILEDEESLLSGFFSPLALLPSPAPSCHVSYQLCLKNPRTRWQYHTREASWDVLIKVFPVSGILLHSLLGETLQNPAQNHLTLSQEPLSRVSHSPLCFPVTSHSLTTRYVCSCLTALHSRARISGRLTLGICVCSSIAFVSNQLNDVVDWIILLQAVQMGRAVKLLRC